MTKFFGLLLLLSTLLCNKVFADAVPFKTHEQIDITYKTSDKLRFDSCGIIYWDEYTNSVDTFSGCNGYNCMKVTEKNKITLTRPIPDTFKVIFYLKDKVLTSPELHPNTGLNFYQQLQITDTDVKDITPIFKTSYQNYFIALSLTILLELLIVLIYFIRYEIPLYNLRYIIYVNLLTHPILWIISANLTGFTAGYLIGEPIVFIIEALVLSKFIIPKLTQNKSLWLSFQMNLTSFIVGGFLYYVITS